MESPNGVIRAAQATWHGVALDTLLTSFGRTLIVATQKCQECQLCQASQVPRARRQEHGQALPSQPAVKQGDIPNSCGDCPPMSSPSASITVLMSWYCRVLANINFQMPRGLSEGVCRHSVQVAIDAVRISPLSHRAQPAQLSPARLCVLCAVQCTVACCGPKNSLRHRVRLRLLCASL